MRKLWLCLLGNLALLSLIDILLIYLYEVDAKTFFAKSFSFVLFFMSAISFLLSKYWEKDGKYARLHSYTNITGYICLALSAGNIAWVERVYSGSGNVTEWLVWMCIFIFFAVLGIYRLPEQK